MIYVEHTHIKFLNNYVKKQPYYSHMVVQLYFNHSFLKKDMWGGLYMYVQQKRKKHMNTYIHYIHIPLYKQLNKSPTIWMQHSTPKESLSLDNHQ